MAEHRGHGHAHEHGHGHAHGHTHARTAASRVFGLAVTLTLGYAAVEVIAGLAFGSLALVSDAGHMFSDAVALALAWFAAWIGSRPPGARHSYGLARAEVIAAFVNGLALLLVVAFICVEAIERLRQPASVNGLGVMVVAFVGLLLNLGVVLILSRGERSLNLRAAMLHVISDLVGSVAALSAGAVIYFTGWAPIDPILSLVIALLILASTVQLLREALHVLMEGVPSSLRLEEVGKLLARIPGVRNVHDLHIWTISSGRAALSAHMDVADLTTWPQILEQARRLLHERYRIDHVTLQPETGMPTGHRDPIVIQMRERS